MTAAIYIACSLLLAGLIGWLVTDGSDEPPRGEFRRSPLERQLFG